MTTGTDQDVLWMYSEMLISHCLLPRLDLLEGLRGDARGATGSLSDVLVGICKL